MFLVTYNVSYQNDGGQNMTYIVYLILLKAYVSHACDDRCKLLPTEPTQHSIIFLLATLLLTTLNGATGPHKSFVPPTYMNGLLCIPGILTY